MPVKPMLIKQLEETFAVGKHAILALNVEDRFFVPEDNIGPANLNYFLAAYFSRKGYRIAQFTPTMGVREFVASSQTVAPIEGLANCENLAELMNGLLGLLRNEREKWIVLVLHAERLNSEGPRLAEMLHIVGLDDGISAHSSRLVLVTYSGLPDELLARSRGYRVLEVGLPPEDERRAFIELILRLEKPEREAFGTLEAGLDVDELCRLTAGMTLAAIEALFLKSRQSGRPVTKLDVRQEKAEVIRNMARDLLSVSEPQEGFEAVAGLASVKDYFRELIPAIRAGCPDVPQAILLQGVQGCGKSHLVKSLSRELNWPLLELRSVRNPYVGQSEMNLEHVIRVVEQLQPAVLFFDEIDQSLGQRGTGPSGDSGTSERLLARIFNWLGALHLRGKVLFVGATNRPDLLDPALVDRFGVAIPFLRPGSDELRDMVSLFLGRFERNLVGINTEDVARQLLPLAPTGRSVQEILVDAGGFADRDAKHMGAAIDAGHVESAVRNFMNGEDESENRFVSLTAVARCRRQSLLPWNGPDGRLRSGAVIPAEFSEANLVADDGRVDVDRLNQIISELKQQRWVARSMR
jgi:SpoVK/Ycf46/Vps4 family AAA+-type ATPase